MAVNEMMGSALILVTRHRRANKPPMVAVTWGACPEGGTQPGGLLVRIKYSVSGRCSGELSVLGWFGFRYLLRLVGRLRRWPVLTGKLFGPGGLKRKISRLLQAYRSSRERMGLEVGRF